MRLLVSAKTSEFDKISAFVFRMVSARFVPCGTRTLLKNKMKQKGVVKNGTQIQ